MKNYQKYNFFLNREFDKFQKMWHDTRVNRGFSAFWHAEIKRFVMSASGCFTCVISEFWRQMLIPTFGEYINWSTEFRTNWDFYTSSLVDHLHGTLLSVKIKWCMTVATENPSTRLKNSIIIGLYDQSYCFYR